MGVRARTAAAAAAAAAARLCRGVLHCRPVCKRGQRVKLILVTHTHTPKMFANISTAGTRPKTLLNDDDVGGKTFVFKIRQLFYELACAHTPFTRQAVSHVCARACTTAPTDAAIISTNDGLSEIDKLEKCMWMRMLAGGTHIARLAVCVCVSVRRN